MVFGSHSGAAGRISTTKSNEHGAVVDHPIHEKPTGAASIPALSQPYHAFPARDGSTGSLRDTGPVDFVFARTTRESVGHVRTRHRHGSGKVDVRDQCAPEDPYVVAKVSSPRSEVVLPAKTGT